MARILLSRNDLLLQKVNTMNVIKSLLRSAIATAALCASITAHAGVMLLAGELTTTDPTFNRPLSLSALSGVGTNVHYDVHGFRVDMLTTYTLEMDAATLSDAQNDGYFNLYANSFNPLAPLSNQIYRDDDSGLGSFPRILNAILTPGIDYFLVVSTFNNGVTGLYEASIRSVLGQASPLDSNNVPVPGSAVLVLLGLAAIARRNAKSATH
jgi:hypothetical protein